MSDEYCILVEKISPLFIQANRILIASHLRPDGDAIGSLIGLGLALEELGKDVQMVLEDGVPMNYNFLYGSEKILQHPKGDVDLIVSLDTSDRRRLGNIIKDEDDIDINIDHHITNEYFARLNLVDLNAVATAEIITKYLANWGMPITKSIASALLSGLLTDTIGFRTHNMRPVVLQLAASLIEKGANLPELYAKCLTNKSFSAIRFWGAGLSNIQRDGAIVWTTLLQTDRKNARYQGRDDADLINVLSTIEDAAVFIIFVEQPNGTVKVSWRALPGFDVSKVAMHFGGGGHPAAAGAEIDSSLEKARSNVLQTTYSKLFSGEKYEI